MLNYLERINKRNGSIKWSGHGFYKGACSTNMLNYLERINERNGLIKWSRHGFYKGACSTA